MAHSDALHDGVELDGKPVGQGFAMGGNKDDDGIRLGVGGGGSAPVKFTKLRLRKVMRGEGESRAPGEIRRYAARHSLSKRPGKAEILSVNANVPRGTLQCESGAGRA